ncbi:hypothetical protein [Brochothrix campestris]|nr:hypothetical protein [Brochothrix campestris]
MHYVIVTLCLLIMFVSWFSGPKTPLWLRVLTLVLVLLIAVRGLLL